MTATIQHTDAKSEPKPIEISNLVQSGKMALENGDLSSALKQFEEVVTSFPDRPEGHNNLGALYNSLGDYQKAESCFSRVLEILPENANIYYNRGVVRSRLEHFDKAREDFLIVLEHSPEDADAHNNLGVTAYMQGRLQMAREHFHKALELKPDSASALMNLCDVERTDNNIFSAITLCEEHLAKYEDIEIRRKMLELLSENCHAALNSASLAAETLLATDTENTAARQELGRLLQAKSAMMST